MTDDEVFAKVDFSVSTGVVPWDDPSEFVHIVSGKVSVYSDTDQEIQAGEIVLRVVLATAATNNGEDLFDVCDADSAILAGIYAALFEKNGETKDELNIEPGWNNLVFLERVEIAAEFRQTNLIIQAIETALAMFASEGLVVAVEAGLDLKVEEWKRLGFIRIARTGFLFRDQLKANPYRDEKSA